MILQAEKLLVAGHKVRDAIAQARLEPNLRLPAPSESGNGTSLQCFTHTVAPVSDEPVCGIPGHRRLWGPRDGSWRCHRCTPARFAGEVVARSEVRP